MRLGSDAVLLTGDEIFEQIVVGLGGLAAEDLMLGSPSTGAEQDLEHATQLARELVGRYGMSERLGRVRLLAHDADEYLGGTATLMDVSDRTHEAFDGEVRRLLDDAEHRARAIVGANTHALEGLVATLLERETLEGEALTSALSGVHTPSG